MESYINALKPKHIANNHLSTYSLFISPALETTNLLLHYINLSSSDKREQAQATANTGMELADRAVGFLLSLISISIFTYYTFWVIILPFVDSDHFIHQYFLPQEYAILLPVFAGVALLCFLCMFVGFVMLKSKKKKA